MKLFHAPSSPFCRKIRIALHAVDLASRVELAQVSLDPVGADAAVDRFNPLHKIPVLVDDQGRALFDSRVILDFIDRLGPDPVLFPRDCDAQVAVARRHALADGITDAAVALRYETSLRPAALQWPAWIDAQTARIRRGLAMLETEAAALHGWRVDTIAAACALDYLRFRFPELLEARAHPALDAFMAERQSHPAMIETAYRIA